MCIAPGPQNRLPTKKSGLSNQRVIQLEEVGEENWKLATHLLVVIYEEIELRISPRNTKTLWINQLMMIGSTARCGSNTRKNIHGQKCLKVVVALGDSLNFIQDLNQKMAIPTADLSKTEGTSIPLRLSNFHPHLSIALSCIIILQSWLVSLYKKKYKEWWSPSRDT